MDRNIVYAKTPTGDEAVRQSTLVEDRNLRMVLVQVDGKLSVGELSLKIGNPPLVEWAIQELEKGGYIAPTLEAVSVWEESKRRAQQDPAPFSVFSEFSTFGPRAGDPGTQAAGSDAGKFSSFGKPIFPSVAKSNTAASPSPKEPAAETFSEEKTGGAGFRLNGKWLLTGLFGLAALGLAGALLYPYDGKRPQIEALASAYLNTTVKVGKVELGVLPVPALKLHDVRLADKGEGIDRISIGSPWRLLGGDTPDLGVVEVSGIRLSAERLGGLPFMQVSPSVKRLSLKQLKVEGLTVLAGALEISGLSGNIMLKPDQSVDKAIFENVDKTLKIGASAADQGVALVIEGSGWRPAASSLRIDSLKAKGTLKTGRLLVHEFDGIALGGLVKGGWLLDWNFGLSLTGDAMLKSLDCRKITEWLVPALKLDGELSGNLRMRATGRDLDSLWANAEGSLSADIARGTFTGVDLGEALRRGGSGGSRAAATRFDRLQVTLAFDPSRVVARDLRLSAGIMSAAGSFVASREQKVDASLMVSLQTSTAQNKVPVRLTGKLPVLDFADAK